MPRFIIKSPGLQPPDPGAGSEAETGLPGFVPKFWLNIFRILRDPLLFCRRLLFIPLGRYWNGFQSFGVAELNVLKEDSKHLKASDLLLESGWSTEHFTSLAFAGCTFAVFRLHHLRDLQCWQSMFLDVVS